MCYMREYNFALLWIPLILYTFAGTIINATHTEALIQDTTGFVLFLIPYLVVTCVGAIWYGRSDE